MRRRSNCATRSHRTCCCALQSTPVRVQKTSGASRAFHPFSFQLDPRLERGNGFHRCGRRICQRLAGTLDPARRCGAGEVGRAGTDAGGRRCRGRLGPLACGRTQGRLPEQARRKIGPATLRNAWQARVVQPLVSTVTAHELIRVLAYPKFRLSPVEQRELLADYLPYATTVTVPQPPPRVPRCRDSFDQCFLELALAGNAHAR